MSRDARGPTFDAVVVGGGLSGLAVAHALQRSGRRVAVLEAAERAGGVLATLTRDGFRYETGANSAIDGTPIIDALLAELRIADQRIDASPAAANRYIVRDGKLEALPASPGGLPGSKAFSLRGKLRLLREPFIARAPQGREESVAAFVERRLGREMLDYAVDPFVSGIYAGDPARLSLPAAFPRLYALEQQHGSLLRGVTATARERKRNGEPRPARPKSFSFRDGMQTLPDALARGLRGLETGTMVTALALSPPEGYAVSGMRNGAPLRLHTRAIVIATPAPDAARLIAPHDEDAASTLASIEYAPVAVVASAYRRDDVAHALDGFGMLVPSRERRRILGTLFSSSLFDHRAPAGHVLLTTFAGGRRNPQMVAEDDASLAQIVERELAELLGARAPLWNAIRRWTRAIPQYDLGHGHRIERIVQGIAKRPGWFFCGSWKDGVSVGDRLASAERVAQSVHAFLQG